MGVTPWSPLKGGVLSGKYTRENQGKVDAKRGGWVTSSLNERAYKVIDALVAVAKETNSTPARVALAWVQSRAGVASTIIGARTIEQLDDNLKALEVKLSPGQIKALDDASAPPPYVLSRFLAPPYSFAYGGANVNGIEHPCQRHGAEERRRPVLAPGRRFPISSACPIIVAG